MYPLTDVHWHLFLSVTHSSGFRLKLHSPWSRPLSGATHLFLLHKPPCFCSWSPIPRLDTGYSTNLWLQESNKRVHLSTSNGHVAVTIAKDENIQSRGEEIASKQGLTGCHESRTGISTAYKLKGH